MRYTPYPACPTLIHRIAKKETPPMPETNQLKNIKHIVQLMLENRSFDQMLGYLYPSGANFDGLTGNEECDGATAGAGPVKVFKIQAKPHGYHMPGCDPGEHFQDTNEQLFGNDPVPAGAKAT